MTKLEKTIRGLECCIKRDPDDYLRCDECPYPDGSACANRLKIDALELLKEQEPVKPTLAIDTWICSRCGHTLESQELIDDKENPQVLVHETYSFCPNCGKAVAWDEPPKEGDGE